MLQRLRRQLVLLQLPRFFSGGGAETARLPSFFVLPPPPAHGAKPHVFLFNLFDVNSFVKDTKAALVL